MFYKGSCFIIVKWGLELRTERSQGSHIQGETAKSGDQTPSSLYTKTHRGRSCPSDHHSNPLPATAAAAWGLDSMWELQTEVQSCGEPQVCLRRSKTQKDSQPLY